MPRLWNLRGVAAVICLMLVSVTVFWEHGRSGILSLWTGEGPHRTAVDRRSQEGAKESVRSLGYLATWAGEWMGGVYRDTSLIYAEKRCPDPNVRFLEQHPGSVDVWCGCPLPPPFDRAALIQVESLDYAAPFLIVNGERVVEEAAVVQHHGADRRLPHKKKCARGTPPDAWPPPRGSRCRGTRGCRNYPLA